MGVRKAYKNYFIEAYPYEFKAGGWKADVVLERDDGRGMLATQFFLDRTLPNESKAIELAIESGKHQIDVGFEPIFR